MTDTLAAPPDTRSHTAAGLFGTFLRTPFRARMWKELGYMLFGYLQGIILFTYLYTGLILAVLLSPFLAGAPLAALVLSGRIWGFVNRPVARLLLDTDLPIPIEFAPRPGFFGWLRSAFTDGPGWRGLLFAILEMVLGLVTGFLTFLLLLLIPLAVSSPVTTPLFHPTAVDSHGRAHHSLFQIRDYFYFDTLPRTLLLAAVGLLAFFGLPWLLRPLCRLHLGLARLLLTPTARERELRALHAARRIAVTDSAATLQRLERDLHDGTQARLVAIAMALGRAEERLTTGGDPVDLVAQARTNAKEALTELRELVRGIHPPALDLGLEPALETLAARCAVVVDLHTELPVRPEPAIEAIGYFAVAELLTNVARHSGADRVAVLVKSSADRLAITVSDNGTGGAVPAGGLAGLADRARTVDGALAVDSPAGGPTVVSMTLPMAVPR